MNSTSDPIKESWAKIAPFWPLQNLIAANPLQGFENIKIEDAFVEGQVHFQQQDLPEPMLAVNRETIKWLQVFLDEGQATIPMPLGDRGLYASWKKLAQFDERLHSNDSQKMSFLDGLAGNPEEVIPSCLSYLKIDSKDHAQFLTIMLTSLSGWASYLKYRTQWLGITEHKNPVSQVDYLAVRLVITSLLWPQAKDMLQYYSESRALARQKQSPMNSIIKNESNYRTPLLKLLSKQIIEKKDRPKAQLVFCIDVRSEPFRKNLESIGDYETLGFAGFFGIPLKIENEVTGESYASCPVLLQPKQSVKERHSCKAYSDYEKLVGIKKFYQSLKYNFATTFALVETLGLAIGIWMALRTMTPNLANKLKRDFGSYINADSQITPLLDDLSLSAKCEYAQGALRIMGLTNNFAPLIVLCGHGSTTQNNAYASALDCGACGGRHGASNARVMSAILNEHEVRQYLAQQGINIPKDTMFIAAEHNTTTDKVTLYTKYSSEELLELKRDLELAGAKNSQLRLSDMGIDIDSQKSAPKTEVRSNNWAQVRPEWGLARNAAFIVAPRSLSKEVNLEGRSFLHSYDWTQDPKGESLKVILTAPMVVAQWINAQYLFSTLDNVAYGGGSKITKNITGKIGLMQGNSSDLMTGLPLQSIYKSDKEAYHELQRLMTVIYAPRSLIQEVVSKEDVLKKLFGNGWVTLSCIEPANKKIYMLERSLTWKELE